jgi:hypothetical protein
MAQRVETPDGLGLREVLERRSMRLPDHHGLT